MNKPPLVSLIIPTLNEEKNIGRCLRSILGQTYKNIEIIVVDNNSTDKTREIVETFKLQTSNPPTSRRTSLKHHPSNISHQTSDFLLQTSNIKLLASRILHPTSNIKLFTHGPERSAQRNYGIKKAKGEYILFLDADMSLSRDVVRDCVRKFTGSRVNELVGLYIPEKIIGDSYWCKVRNFERSFYDATVIDCVRFFPKKIWQEVGGFDETLTGPEDWDFDKKVRSRGKVGIIKSPLYHNEANFNLKDYLEGKSYYTKSIDRYIKKWGGNDPNVKKQLGFSYRFIGVFIENGKWRKLLAHPILTLGVYFLRGMVGVFYLINKKYI